MRIFASFVICYIVIHVFDVLKVNKSIYRGFRAIIFHLVHQKIDINTIVSKIATPVKPRKKRLYIGQFELLLYIIYCNSYFSKVIMVDKRSL